MGPLGVFYVFLKLGLTSFGGPVAHLGYFRTEFVERRKWLSDHAYADLVALCQFLPGPASSQVSMAIGIQQAGLKGAFAAWLGFSAPSAIILFLFAIGLDAFNVNTNASWIHGLKVAAVAIVAHALWSMAKGLTPDKERITIAILAAMTVLLIPTAFVQILVITIGAGIGFKFLKADKRDNHVELTSPIDPKISIICLLIFALILVLLPTINMFAKNHTLILFDHFYRAGALVFGGGHVVLPLLESAIVPPGWISKDMFLAGYGLAQAVPGPLFTFSAYLGAAMSPQPNGLIGALICLIAIFLPSFLLIAGALPFWDRLRRFDGIQNTLCGVNSVVVGILLAALYDPVWTAGIKSADDFAIAIGAFLILTCWKAPSWLVVFLCALTSSIITNIDII